MECSGRVIPMAYCQHKSKEMGFYRKMLAELLVLMLTEIYGLKSKQLYLETYQSDMWLWNRFDHSSWKGIASIFSWWMLLPFLQIDLERNSTTWFGTSVPTTQFREEVLQESDDVARWDIYLWQL